MSKPILQCSLEVYRQRLQRMKRLIDLNAPAVVIESEARLLLRSFRRRSLLQAWDEWKFEALPNWLLWLVSADYREIRREPLDNFEAEMRELLRPTQPAQPASSLIGFPALAAREVPENAAPTPPVRADKQA